MAGFVPPLGVQQLFDNDGKPLAGGYVGTLLNGQSLASPLYSDRALRWPYTDPLRLDAAGRTPGPAWMDQALSYRLQIDAADTSNVVPLVDNLTQLPSVPIVTVTATGGPVTVAVPSAPIVSVQLHPSASPLTIAGFTGGAPGQLLVLRGRAGVSVVTSLVHQSLGAAAGDRLTNQVSSSPTLIIQNGAAIYQRGPTGEGWYLLTHDQGQMLDWTPVWTFGGASVGVTYAMRSARLFLRGTYVTGSLRIGLSAKGTSTGQAIITGWPYTTLATGNGGVVQWTGNFTGLTGRMSAYLVPANLYLFMHTAGGVTGVVDTNCTNLSDVMVDFDFPAL